MEKHIVINRKCVRCELSLAVRVVARPGSGAGGLTFTCPKCGTEQNGMPATVLDVTVVEEEE